MLTVREQPDLTDDDGRIAPDAAPSDEPDAGAPESDTPTPTPRTQDPTEPNTAASAGVRGPSLVEWVVLFAIAAVGATALQVATGATTHGYFGFMLASVICARAAWTDAATRFIPNALTYPAILIGFGVSALGAGAALIDGGGAASTWIGAPTLTSSLLGFAICAAIGIPSFIAGGLGGGDVKLLGGMGAMLGLHASDPAAVTIGPVLFNTLVVAAVVGILNMALSGHLVRRLQVMAASLLVMAITKKPLDLYPFKTTEAPFGVALLIGTVMAAFPALRLHTYVLEAL